jgi:hypothetical protein
LVIAWHAPFNHRLHLEISVARPCGKFVAIADGDRLTVR